jgi:hypothetical protein
VVSGVKWRRKKLPLQKLRMETVLIGGNGRRDKIAATWQHYLGGAPATHYATAARAADRIEKRAGLRGTTTEVT